MLVVMTPSLPMKRKPNCSLRDAALEVDAEGEGELGMACLRPG